MIKWNTDKAQNLLIEKINCLLNEGLYEKYWALVSIVYDKKRLNSLNAFKSTYKKIMGINGMESF